MQVVPLQVTAESFDIFVILEDDNLERMKAYDPAEVVKAHLGKPWEKLKLRNIMIGYATAEDLANFHDFVLAGDVEAGLKWLSRGWAYRPERGDSDRNYESLRPKGEKP